MKGTNRYPLLSSSGAAERQKSFVEFITANRQLLLFCLLFIGGVLLGVIVYGLSRVLITGELSTILEGHVITGGLEGCVSELFSSCFSTILLLALLFLCGLSACGALFSVIVPVFFGLGLGLTEAYYYSTGVAGMIATGLLVVPHYLIAAAALLLGTMESVRMSLLFSRQLLPGGSIGSLWEDFRLYCARFLVFAGIAFASGVVDVCLRLLFGQLFH